MDTVFYLKSSPDKNPSEFRLLSFKQEWTPYSNTIKVLFNNRSDNKEYLYEWASTASQGLAYLYHGKELIYDPYSRNNKSEHYALCEIGRQLSILFRQQRAPKTNS